MKRQFLAVQTVSKNKTLNAGASADKKNCFIIGQKPGFIVLSQSNRQDSGVRQVFLF